MTDIIRYNKNDYGIAITYTVRNPDTGAVINISDADTVTLTIGRLGESTPLVDNGSMSLVANGTQGQVTYTPPNGTLDTSGYYDGEIHVNYTNGRRTTRKFTLHILEEL